MATIRPQPRPRRRIHWQTPVTLVVLVGILAGGAWWGWNSLTESTAEPVCEWQQLPNGKLTPDQVEVNVYNAGARDGTARATADALRKRGFRIGRIANEPSGQKIRGVAVRGAGSNVPQTRLLQLQMKQKAPIVVDQRTDPSVDVLVGAGFTGLNTGLVTSVPVPGGRACVPVNPKEKPIPTGQNPG
jgi:LytR cell envelope-related transcriptional attenuator